MTFCLNLPQHTVRMEYDNKTFFASYFIQIFALRFNYDNNDSLFLIKNIGYAEFIDNRWHLREINETIIDNSLIDLR